MRTIVRVGLICGISGFIGLYALGAVAALVAAAGVALVGLVAGLSAAKWLERPWFGRQLIAGLRAGAVSCILSASGALLALLSVGPQNSNALMARSHLLGLDLGAWAQTFAGAGWVGTDILTVLTFALVGVMLAAVSAQLTAWSKNTHAIRIVAQARQAAQALNRDDGWRATTGIPAFGVTGMGSSALGYTTSGPALGFGSGPLSASSLASVAPFQSATPPMGTMAASSSAATSAAYASSTPGVSTKQPAPVRFGPPQATERDSVAPRLAGDHSPTPPRLEPAGAQQTEPTTPSVTAAELAARMEQPQAPKRKNSAARPADTRLNDAMRDALATWASDAETDGAQKSGKDEKVAARTPARTPAPSAYLNSDAPAPRRVPRKKQNTDWLR